MSDRLLEHLEARWGPPKRSGHSGKHGAWYDWLCPWCDDTTGKFRVFVRENGAGGKCIRCGRPGKGEGVDIYTILAELEGVPRAEVRRRLGQDDSARAQAGLAELFRRLDPKNRTRHEPAPVEENRPVLFDTSQPEPEAPRRPQPRPRQTEDTWIQWDQLFCDIIEPPTLLGLDARDYLFGRGIPRAIIERYHIRYAEHEVGLDAKTWVFDDDLGKKVPSVQTRQHGRIMFPVVNRGEVVFYQGRDFIDRDPKVHPRYLSSKKGRDTPFGAGEVLMGLDECWGKETVVVGEGPVDWLKLHLALSNRFNIGAVGLLGHGMTLERIELLKQAGCKKLILWYDKDLPLWERVQLYEFVNPYFPTTWTESQTDKKDPGASSMSEIIVGIKAARGMSLLDRMGV